ncbi:hypothetical protein CC2G_011404 [Coprinopsis cinerea AmutBmut pab1-1]|nr:hypothetical protein CC2G_011404 [Coprinopsis cinerea AmutBmut pab1-1]
MIPQDSHEIPSISLKHDEWYQAHCRIKDHPPRDRCAYLRHARALLPLFEGIVELHPVMKAVFFSFKAVVNFEHERLENDLRVSCVYFAASDMMSVVLEIAMLVRDQQDPGFIASNTALLKLLEKIQADTKACGNAIDSYYNEGRLVKFLKAPEWKAVMVEFTQIFINHRINLQTTVSLRIARTVDDIGSKMKILIAHAFTPQHSWEKNLRAKLKEFGPRENWINDVDKVKALAQASEDKIFDFQTLTANGSPQDSVHSEQRWKAFAAGLNENLDSSLPQLFARNMKLFEQKLDFHTQELRDSIASSAKYIVRSLAGPYDRLQHEDLRKLWKEMNWIFCVEGRHFAIALYEYYLDYFHSKYSTSSSGLDGEPGELSPEDLAKRREDMWTLEYLERYSEKINDAVDNDRSGFIRISEVNSFTNQIPVGWTLPQYCVYVSVGWEYELRIYQKRVRCLLDKLCEAQMRVLPENREGLLDLIYWCDTPSLLARGCQKYPDDKAQHLPEGFCNRIKEKIKAQDERMRTLWRKFKYNFNDRSIIAMLYPEKKAETFVLQLYTILLEYALDVVHICRTQRIDRREWERFLPRLGHIEALLDSRIEELKDEYKRKGHSDVKEAIQGHYGGIFRPYHMCSVTGCLLSPTKEEAEHHYMSGDPLSLKDFPIPTPNTELDEILEYSTGQNGTEETSIDFDRPEIGSETSKPDIGESLSEGDENPDCVPPAFPYQNAICDICKVVAGCSPACYHCIDCDDFNICESCFRKSPSDSLHTGGHEEDHDLVRMVLFFPHDCVITIKAAAKHQRRLYWQSRGFLDAEELESDGEEDDEDVDGDGWDDEEGDGEEEGKDQGDEGTKLDVFEIQPDHCVACRSEIASERFYQCIHYECLEPRHCICFDCFSSLPENEGEGDRTDELAGEGPENTRTSHKPWHSLLLMHRLDPDDPWEGVEEDDEDDDTLTTESGHPPPDDRISALEKKIETLESNINQVNAHVMDLKGLMSALLERLS